MSFPGITTSSKEEAEAESGGGGAPKKKASVVDDGFTPEQRRKNQLELDDNFKKYHTMLKMRMPLINIRKRLQADPEGSKLFTIKDLDLFCDKE